MKFDYKLYTPRKIIKDAYVTASSYYKAEDVHVNPLTKIGDVADMPKSTKRKPIFTKSFNRDRLAFAPRSKTKRKSIPVRMSEEQQNVPIKRIAQTLFARNNTKKPRVYEAQVSSKARPITARIRNKLTPTSKYALGGGVRNILPKLQYAMLGAVMLIAGVTYIQSQAPGTEKSSADTRPGEAGTSGGADELTNQQKSKARPNSKNDSKKGEDPQSNQATPPADPPAAPTDEPEVEESYDYSEGESWTDPPAPAPSPAPAPQPVLPEPAPEVAPPVPAPTEPLTPVPDPSNADTPTEQVPVEIEDYTSPPNTIREEDYR